MKNQFLLLVLCLAQLASAAQASLVGIPTQNTRTGDGLNTRYYKSLEINNSPNRTEISPEINSYQPISKKLKPFLPHTHYAVAYEGYLKSPKTGEVELSFTVDDGVRVWLQDRLIIDSWVGQSVSTYSAKVNLTKDHLYTLRIEYFQASHDATQRLEWDANGQKEVIKQQYLFSSLPGDAQTAAQVLYDKEELASGKLVSGDGFNIQFFEGKEFETPRGKFYTSSIDYHFYKGEAPFNYNRSKNYSLKINGFIKAPKTGNYTLSAGVDDGIRMRVNGKQIINKWNARLANHFDGKELYLEEGEYYEVEVEYFQADYDATLRLKWNYEGLFEMPIAQEFLFSEIPQKEEEKEELLVVNIEDEIIETELVEIIPAEPTSTLLPDADKSSESIIDEGINIETETKDLTSTPIKLEENTLAEVSADVSVYPNPTTGRLFVEYQSDYDLIEVGIYTASAQEIFKLTPRKGTVYFRQAIEIEQVSEGAVFVRFTTAKGILTKKVIIQ